MLDVFEGKGPLYIRTEEAIAKLAEKYEDNEKAYKKKMKELEAEAWEDFLDMTISQALLWAATNIEPEKRSSEIAAAEPYFIGSHSGASGAWVSGPGDLAGGTEYFWGYCNMTTIKGMFAAGDASGASSHKFSSGSHVEGRIAAKSAIKFILENNTRPHVDPDMVNTIKRETYKPLEVFEKYKGVTTDPQVNPNYIMPKMFMFRLQKMMDEYVGGVSSNFSTNKASLKTAMELMGFLKEDQDKLAACDLHQLMRCWENRHRLLQAESHIRTVMFREETRWPGYYFRTDFPELNEENWLCFVNTKFNPEAGEWSVFKRPILNLFSID